MRIFEIYENLLQLPPEQEVKLQPIADSLDYDYTDFLKATMYEHDFSSCTCEFEDEEQPTAEELMGCSCEPELTERNVEKRIEGTQVYVKAGDLLHILMEMPNAAGQELRDEAMDLVHITIEEATGVSHEQQDEMLATALAHCNEDDTSALENLLTDTMERVREHFKSKR